MQKGFRTQALHGENTPLRRKGWRVYDWVMRDAAIKLMKWTVALMVASSYFGLGAAARANADLTYVFTSGPGQPTVLNGSFFTIDSADDSVVGWDLLDTTALPSLAPYRGFGLDSAFPSGAHSGILTEPGTLLQSSLHSASTSGFAGSFGVYDFSYPVGAFDFISPNGLSDVLVVWSDRDPDLDPIILGHNITGTWQGTIPFSAPDAANTFALLLASACAMGFWRHRARAA
jgi:hypothetical protein